MTKVNLSRIVLEAHKVILKHESEMLMEQLEERTRGWPGYLAAAYSAGQVAVFAQYARSRLLAVAAPAKDFGKTMVVVRPRADQCAAAADGSRQGA